ncbi:MAG: 4Fe-4S dicluster domain-containing protein [Planctomycetes bacterium]|nr:4Fe-4S dicluster domain-containing protein [Planctomycetota bacterium]
MAKIKTIINDREVEVERDRWALDVAREMGISIPTLCHHPALEPYGACRLCVVEVTKGKWTWLATSCDLPVREGLSIKTDTPAVTESRKTAIELLWARAPEAEALKSLAAELGVEKSRFTPRNDMGKCILCGLCVRICDKLIGASAISFANRGHSRRVIPPFEESSNTCTGCNACAAVCPTGHICTEDKDGVRNMKTWRTKIDMIRCEICGEPYIPGKQFESIQARAGGQMVLAKVCPACRRTGTVARFKAATCGSE